MSKPVVTLVQFSGKRDGAALSALTIAEGFRNRHCKVHLVFGTSGEAFELSKDRGFSTHLWEHKNWLRDPRLIGFVKNFYLQSTKSKAFLQWLHKHPTDLVYVNTMASLGAMIAARRMHLPSIWHIREQFQEDGGELRVPHLVKPLLPHLWKRYTDAFIYNTHIAKASMYGSITGGKVIPVGIDSSFGQDPKPKEICRSKLNLPLDATLIGIPGGLRKVKGHEWFLRATSTWLKANPSVQVALAGTGTEQMTRHLEKMVADNALTERIHFLGPVEDMSLFYHACNLICIPSRGESFGRCAVEAMACRIPLVVSAVGGLKELIHHEENGLLVNYEDNQGLIMALERLVNQFSLAEHLSERAYQDFCNRYTESVYQDAICNYTLETLQQSRP